jgi:hypothetical protein
MIEPKTALEDTLFGISPQIGYSTATTITTLLKEPLMNRIATLSIVTLALMGSTGCATVYVQKSSQLADATAPRSTLLAGSMVRVGRTHKKEVDIVDAALTAAMGSYLGEFGVKVTKAATDFVSKHGMQVVTDSARASKLSQASALREAVEAIETMGAIWYAPEGSTKTLDSSTSLLFGKKAFIEAADDAETPNEAFMFVSGRIYEQTGFFIMKKPVFHIEIRVLDEQGEDLMRASGIGEGAASPFVMDRQLSNLQRALDGALQSLSVVAVETF